jgi:polyhydroxybutyrate depolymerase
MESMTGFDDLADKENFIVVYPDGLNNVWNDGRRGDPRISNVDDVHFLENGVQFIEKMLNIDANKVYAAGYSMGGMMAYRLACALPSRFAAVASVASTMPIYLLDICDSTVPVPVIVFQGTDDPIVPWMGIPNGYLSAAQTIGFWGNHNQCTGGFVVENLPDTDPTDHTLVMRQQLKDCTADMVLYGVYWGGHTWPGHSMNIAELGQTSQDIDASALIWEFFNAHGKAAAK